MTQYRAIVHYHLKKGMEEQAFRFLESELMKKAAEWGCHHIEILQNDQDPTSFIGIALWHSIEDARKFQAHWEKKEKEFQRFCTSEPRREFCKIRSNFQEKMRKAA